MPRRNSRSPKKRVAVKRSYVNKATTRHLCNWPGCTKMVSANTWGCTPHYKTLPVDYRAMIAKAWGPPKLVHYPKLQAKVVQWIKNQNPANYPGIPFP